MQISSEVINKSVVNLWKLYYGCTDLDSLDALLIAILILKGD